jgi:hypothetical protein
MSCRSTLLWAARRQRSRVLTLLIGMGSLGVFAQAAGCGRPPASLAHCLFGRCEHYLLLVCVVVSLSFAEDNTTRDAITQGSVTYKMNRTDCGASATPIYPLADPDLCS